MFNYQELACIKEQSRSEEFYPDCSVQFQVSRGKPGELSYPELTEPLRPLTRKNARFVWGTRESAVFEELKARLCSFQVLVPYDTHWKTQLYVDSSL